MKQLDLSPKDLAHFYQNYTNLVKDSMDFLFSPSAPSQLEPIPYSKSSFYDAIGSGDIDTVTAMVNRYFLYIITNFPQVSFRIHKNKIKTSIETMVLFLKQHDIPEDLSSYLSRHYLHALNDLKTERDVNLLHFLAIFEFTRIAAFSKQVASLSSTTQYCIIYLYQNDIKKITTEQIAKTLCIPNRSLSALFQEDTGLSINSFCHRIRINYCKLLLTLTGTSTATISSMFHYSSERYFSKVFKEHTGYSPQSYRKQFYLEKSLLGKS